MAEELTPDVEQAEHEVEQAIEHTAEAAKSAPTATLEDMLRDSHQVLLGIHAELKRSNDLREAEKETSKVAEPVEDVVEPIVEVPKKEIKYARRGLRKVRVD